MKFARLGILTLLACPAVAFSDWQALTTDLVKAEKPGYGGLSGVIVERKTGDVYVFLSDKGLYRSKDQGKTWAAAGTPLKGRTETPGCMLIDPLGGKKMVLALVYGAPISVAAEPGAAWKMLDKKSGHVDWFAADWSDPDLKFILTLKHESGGTLLASHDGGKTFTEVGKDFGPAWIFDKQTAVLSEAKSKTKPNPRLLRTTDAGKTFQPVADYSARALPIFTKGTLYWLTDAALIASTDKGRTWKKITDLKNGRYGPVFGKTADHMFVMTTAGIVESTDAGATWAKPLPLPMALKNVSYMTWLDYDPVHDVLYSAKMTADLYKFDRKK